MIGIVLELPKRWCRDMESMIDKSKLHSNNSGKISSICRSTDEAYGERRSHKYEQYRRREPYG